MTAQELKNLSLYTKKTNNNNFYNNTYGNNTCCKKKNIDLFILFYVFLVLTY